MACVHIYPDVWHFCLPGSNHRDGCFGILHCPQAVPSCCCRNTCRVHLSFFQIHFSGSVYSSRWRIMKCSPALEPAPTVSLGSREVSGRCCLLVCVAATVSLERMRRPMPRKDSNASNRPLRSVASLPEGVLKSNDSAPRPSVHSTFDWEI